MTAKHILFDAAARTQIARGLDALANAVKVTLGPRGRNVVLARGWGAPISTKDGVTVAKEVELDDHFANLGAQLVKEVAARTSDVAGDGTTTATVLAQAIYSQGARLVAAGIDPMELKRGIDAAVEAIVSDLARQSRPVRGRDEIAQVGIVSANGDVMIGHLIAEAMEKVGKDGVITVEAARSIETSLEIVLGMQFDRGYLSPYFVTDPARMEVVLADAYILVHERRLSTMAALLPLLEAVATAGKPLLVIAEDLDGEALATLVVNKLRGTLAVCAVKAPGFGDQRKELLEDLAMVTGGRAITEELGLDLEHVTLADLGRAKKITIDKDRTILIEGAGTSAAITARANQLRVQLEAAPSDHVRTQLQGRLAKLVGGVAVIEVGAATETELAEKTARVDDALHATRAAVEEGIVAGGGVALLRALPALDALELAGDRRHGVDIIRRALDAPLRQMAANAGVDGSLVVSKVRSATGSNGYNVATGRYEDLIAAGVIDPTKVVRVALQNAASIAAIMLTTEVLIAASSPGDARRE